MTPATWSTDRPALPEGTFPIALVGPAGGLPAAVDQVDQHHFVEHHAIDRFGGERMPSPAAAAAKPVDATPAFVG